LDENIKTRNKLALLNHELPYLEVYFKMASFILKYVSALGSIMDFIKPLKRFFLLGAIEKFNF
jgi:hypothetical protein